MSHNSNRLFGAVVTLLLLAVGPAAGAADQGKWFVGVYGGDYDPGPSVVDDEATFGARFGYLLTPRVAISASVGVADAESKFDQSTFTGNVKGDFTFLDFNAFYMFRPEKRFRFTAGGGLGGAFASFDGQVTGPGATVVFSDFTDESLTLNAGFGPVFRINDQWILRLLNRYRWFENREDDEVDQETTLGVGYTFGY
jgi:hypothetical protein